MKKIFTSYQNSYNSWAIYLRLLQTALPYWVFFVVGVLGTILGAGTDALLTWAVKPIMDNWNSMVQQGATWYYWIPLLIIAILLLRGVGHFLANYYLTRVGRNLVRDFRQHIFSHLLYLPASYYDKESSGKLLSVLLYNTEQVAGAATEALITILQEGMLLIALFIVMCKLSWQLTLIFLATAPIISAIVRYTSKRLRYLSSNVQIAMGNVAHIAEEGIENYKVVRIFGGEEYEKEKFFAATQHNRQREMKVVVTNSLGTSLTQVITAIPIAIIVFVAINPFFHISLGSFGAFVVAVLGLLTPLRRLTKINAEVQKSVAAAHSIFSLLEEHLEEDQGTKTIKRASGAIEYRNVNFRYPGMQQQLLQDINFKIEPGQKIAIVGRSGSGKTTLVNLLPRFYDLVAGEILIDGVNIRDYKLAALRQQFSIVAQHLTLFNDTIGRNIAYGALQTATPEKITRAAAAAHILEFVDSLPERFATIIGENGVLLSGGQRQRLAIARALLKDAPILILDEATSALDTEAEHYIQEALAELMKQRTTLVIAHRLSTVEHADKILVLAEGRIVEVGTHVELLALEGHYAKLYKMQFKEES